jgi:hypothetical protein
VKRTKNEEKLSLSIPKVYGGPIIIMQFLTEQEHLENWNIGRANSDFDDT